MAKKPAVKAAATEEISPIDLEGAYTAEPISEALSALYSEMGIEGELASFVTVHKVLPDSQKEARVWKDSVDKYDLDAIAKRFGSGEYTVRVYVQREDRSYSCRGSKSFHMMLDAADDARIAATREGKLQGVAAAPAPQGMGIAEVIALMQKAQENTVAMLKPILENATGAKQNTMADLKGLAETFAMLPKPAAGGDMMQAFTMFQKFMELTKSMNPEKPLTEDEVGPNALMMKGLQFLIETAGKAKENAAAAAPKPHLPPLVNPGLQPHLPPVLPARPVPADEDAEMQLFLKMQLAMMLRAAANDSDVEPYAVLVFEQAPDEIIDKLQQPEWFAALVEVEQQCAAFQIWFTKLRDRVVELLAEDAKNDPANTLTGKANATTVAG